ncbi:hypothetical protein IW146_009989, partial [Coemansia sp. RSA 922]
RCIFFVGNWTAASSCRSSHLASLMTMLILLTTLWMPSRKRVGLRRLEAWRLRTCTATLIVNPRHLTMTMRFVDLSANNRHLLFWEKKTV